jgi:PAS domain S-box-containing protein
MEGTKRDGGDAGDGRPGEHFHRSLVEDIPDALVLLGADGTVVYASPAVVRLLGRTQEAVTGSSAFDYVHPDDVEATRARFGQLLAGSLACGPSAGASARFRVLTATGASRWLDVTTSNRLHDPEVGGVVAVCRDVTERVGAEQERAATARLEGALLVARTVAHELNNALSPVAGYAELLAMRAAERNDQVAAGYARLIAEAAELAATKVGNLQRIVRLEPTVSSDPTVPVTLDLERSTSQTPAGS